MEGFTDWSVLNLENKEFRTELIRKFDEKNPRVYNPQMTKGEPYKFQQGRIGEAFGGTKKDDIVTQNTGERYQKSTLSFAYCSVTLHPTQQPNQLLPYPIQT